MKIEKWKYKDTEVEVPIFDEDEIETNETFDNIDSTIDLTNIIKEINDNEQ